MSRRVLMIAFHFPPLRGSSGIQRTLSFARHLHESGWEPLILSAHPRAYPDVDHATDWRLPPGLIVERAMAFDTARQLSIAGRYPQWMALPDRWASWQLGAIAVGLAMIRRHRPAAIWSTYPIATAHNIGARLQQLSGLPWVADFRDPMAHDGYPADARTWQSFKRVEERVFARAARVCFTTDGARRFYAARYPKRAKALSVIGNGYDETAFAGLAPQPRTAGTPWLLLHSGVVYPEWRDPAPLFAALRRLIDAGHPEAARLRIRFRASEHDEFVLARAGQHGVAAQIELAPPLPYREALQEMLSADALLVLQSDGCNDQIPAKSYEYLRAARPVLTLAAPGSETATLFASAPQSCGTALEAATGIEAALQTLLERLASGNSPTADPDWVRSFSRQAQATALGHVLDEAVTA
ncbi:glycosyltransferase [Uliginosibacterium sp. H1]|uniref:glycosyltransferase n=1 Tax=Uliginosibacterium sp. H1 TaxID=3114757 RepID=UPI002E17317B|nr:glycosyltransferase [Uliginosibacterium sp. H1]